VSIDICYCEKLFLSFCFFFRVFFVWCNKVIFCTDVRYSVLFLFDVLHRELKCFMNVKTYNANSFCEVLFLKRFLWQCVYAIDCVVKMLFLEMYMLFLYILVFALYVQNRKSFCHCKTWLRRCKSFKPCWLLANVKKNVLCLNYKHFEDMIRIVDVGFFLTQHFEQPIVGENNLWRLHCLCYIFLCMRQICFLVSLFYGKCYVTIFVRELLRSPIAIGENFLLKMRRNCLESFFFHRKRWFLFLSFSFVFRIDCFFWERFFPLHFIFFLVVKRIDGFCWFCDLLFFHSYEKT